MFNVTAPLDPPPLSPVPAITSVIVPPPPAVGITIPKKFTPSNQIKPHSFCGIDIVPLPLMVPDAGVAVMLPAPRLRRDVNHGSCIPGFDDRTLNETAIADASSKTINAP